MAAPRIRDLIAHVTTLPAAAVIAVCLFLPQTRTCSGRVETPFESGTWLAIAPLVLLGLAPLVWRLVPRARGGMPEVALSFTLLVLALFVFTLPLAIYLVWGYAKRTFRGELLVAMCGAACVAIWLLVFPFITVFADWLPAARWTSYAAALELVGMIAWTSAATTRLATGR